MNEWMNEYINMNLTFIVFSVADLVLEQPNYKHLCSEVRCG